MGENLRCRAEILLRKTDRDLPDNGIGYCNLRIKMAVLRCVQRGGQPLFLAVKAIQKKIGGYLLAVSFVYFANFQQFVWTTFHDASQQNQAFSEKR